MKWPKYISIEGMESRKKEWRIGGLLVLESTTDFPHDPQITIAEMVNRHGGYRVVARYIECGGIWERTFPISREG